MFVQDEFGNWYDDGTGFDSSTTDTTVNTQVNNDNSSGANTSGTGVDNTSGTAGGTDQSNWSTITNQDGSKTVYDGYGNPVYTVDKNNVMTAGPGMGSSIADLIGGSMDSSTFGPALKKLLGGQGTTGILNSPAGIASALYGAYGMMGGGNKPQTAGWKGSIPTLSKVSSVIPQQEYKPYSGQPVMGRQMITPTQYVAPDQVASAQAAADQQAKDIAAKQTPVQAATGGLMGLNSFAKGGQPQYLRGNTDGMADKLDTSIDGVQPAKLSHGEFVIPADVVSHLGNGNSDAGADALYKMMERVRKARTGNPKQGKRINAEKFTGGIAKYAAGGNVQSFATGDLVSSSGTTGSTLPSSLTQSPYGYSQESNLSGWAGDYVGNMLGKTQALANAPYQAYTGPLTAGTSPLQTQAFDAASNLTVPTSIGSAANTAGNIASKAQDMSYNPVGTDFNAQQAQQYMNPYLKSALDPQMAELQRQNQIANMNANAKLTQAGGFGGGRQAVMNAENQRNMMQQMNTTLGQGYSTAFDKAMAQFNADQARKTQEAQFGASYGLQGLNTGLQAAQAQGQLGTAQNQAGLANLSAQMGAGATQRDIEQQGITANQAQFEKERMYPYQQLQFQQSMLQGLPIGTTVTTPNLSDLQKAGYTASEMQSLYDLISKIPGMGPTVK